MTFHIFVVAIFSAQLICPMTISLLSSPLAEPELSLLELPQALSTISRTISKIYCFPLLKRMKSPRPFYLNYYFSSDGSFCYNSYYSLLCLHIAYQSNHL